LYPGKRQYSWRSKWLSAWIGNDANLKEFTPVPISTEKKRICNDTSQSSTADSNKNCAELVNTFTLSNPSLYLLPLSYAWPLIVISIDQYHNGTPKENTKA
jgi:hypothetical protein